MNTQKLTREAIRDSFSAAENENQLIGIEGEKIGIIWNTGEPGAYAGKNGYLAILGKMYEELGWEISKQEDRNILQLKRGNSLIDLESDGRIELAGSPYESIHDVAREFRIHQNEITEVSDVFGISWLGIGYHPLSNNEAITDVQEARKLQMLQYFTELKEKTKNDFGLAWYKKTAGIHVSVDYASELDFGRKLRALFRLSPILMAMFANSPFSKGENTRCASYRYFVTRNNEIPRFQIDKELYDSDFGYDAWIDHVLNQPIIFLDRGEEWIHPNCSFRRFMEEGFEGHEATMADFEMHMKSMWMDVRARNTIELRCIDSLPPHLVPAVPALIKGLFYSEASLQAVEALIETWSFDEYNEMTIAASELGLQAQIHNQKLLDVAKQLLQLADTALQTDRINDIRGNDESVYLEPIKELILVKGQSPAEWLVHQWENDWNHDFFPVFEWCRY